MRPPILAATSALLLLASALAAPAEAQRERRGRCTGSIPEELANANPPVYLDCEVDRAARGRGTAPTPAWRPDISEVAPGRCYRAELQFVVDTAGTPEPGTVTTRTTNNAGLADALRAVVPGLRYEPARLEGVAVRQVVVYATAVEIRSSADPSRARARC